MTAPSIPAEILQSIRLVIFDLDGTLIDSRRDLIDSVNAMRRRMNLEALPEEVIASYVGRGVATLIRRALANGSQGEVAHEAVDRANRFFLNYYWVHKLDHTVAYDGVRGALEALADRKLAVLTNKPVVFSRAILAGLGLTDYFCFVYGGNSFAEKKPDPCGILKLMSDTASCARQTMIVGDSDTDVLTGRNAGIWTCGVTYGLAPQTLVTTPPDVLLGDLRELPRLLNGHTAAVEGRVKPAAITQSELSGTGQPPTRSGGTASN